MPHRLDKRKIDVTRKLTPKSPLMAPEAFKARLKELGLTQSKVAEVWGFSPDLVSRWATGKVPVPGWVGHALDGIKYGRLVKMSKDRGYPWPPVGYS